MLKILITNQKGGVGKSTISANLAYYFASVTKKRTTLIDFDTQGSSSKWVRAVQPQNIAVYNAKLPLSGGTNRILIDCRNIMRIASKKSEIIIADLTWFDVFDSEMFLEFDLIVLPTAVSEVELIATMEFAERHQWVFNSSGNHPSLVIVPSRVRKDQSVTFKHSTERFPFSFLLTPPVLDSVEAKKSFCKNYLLDLKKHFLKESFFNFCQAIEQTSKIHSARKASNQKLINNAEKTKVSRLNSCLSYEIKKAEALKKIKRDREQTFSLTNQPFQTYNNLIEVNKISASETIFLDKRIIQDKKSEVFKHSFKNKSWKMRNLKLKEPILNLNRKKRKKTQEPISSSSRQLQVEPPLFLKKQNS